MTFAKKKKLTEDKETPKIQNEENKIETKEESKIQSENQTSSEKKCQYVKKNNGYWGNYGTWSNWSQTAVNKTNSREVQTKVEKTQISNTLIQAGTTSQTKTSTKILVTQNGVKKYLYICPSDYDNAGSYDSQTTCVKTTIKYKSVPVYKNITYYRYRTRQYINQNNSYVWSKCNDENLINKGYKSTGNVK